MISATDGLFRLALRADSRIAICHRIRDHRTRGLGICAFGLLNLTRTI